MLFSVVKASTLDLITCHLWLPVLQTDIACAMLRPQVRAQFVTLTTSAAEISLTPGHFVVRPLAVECEALPGTHGDR